MAKNGRHRVKQRSVRSRTVAALAGGALVVLPALTSSGLPIGTPVAAGDQQSIAGGPAAGPGADLPPVGVDGSLPQPPVPQALGVPGYAGTGSATPSGPLGIPDSMLKAYRNAADIMAREQPGCHVDWALIAAIGRVESNHARGGYVDARGNGLERILGPVLDGAGGFAAIRDTDGGRYDGDQVWDRAVGPTQFIPSTWARYASDGNGDGVSDPNNIYDETLATARYLCSGGLDLSGLPAQALAVRRYNNSQSYVDTVLGYAAAYRAGVSQLPDSQVPIGAPPGPGAVEAAAGSPAGVPAPPPAPPATSAPGTPAQPPSSSSSSTSTSGSPTSSTSTGGKPTGSTPTSGTPTSSTTTSTTPTCPSTPTTTPTSTTTTSTPPGSTPTCPPVTSTNTTSTPQTTTTSPSK
ncbi:membrane-bound lytic murein transglycosylase B [Amycolatopsis sulphurea]|uniref:Membrane-bound lytic murein transglycosylase B n=1 Tax=Amycolatopsis sulphurea TaxID=76022 RepID=A0A2A9FFT4_9PSEU|nr:lytic murein transglycosylase [Amycolatopsis sulphurea]PFG49793.1 membrane-bound lytic murein transglycosylase B [Amycolatopsis sulphurea]